MKRASSICVGAREGLVSGCKCRRDNPRLYGAGEGNRTPDLLITSEPLCRLSYPGLEPPRLSAPRQKYRQYRKRHTRVGAIGSAALRPRCHCNQARRRRSTLPSIPPRTDGALAKSSHKRRGSGCSTCVQILDQNLRGNLLTIVAEWPESSGKRISKPVSTARFRRNALPGGLRGCQTAARGSCTRQYPRAKASRPHALSSVAGSVSSNGNSSHRQRRSAELEFSRPYVRVSSVYEPGSWREGSPGS